jgi:hypothetical protein
MTALRMFAVVSDKFNVDKFCTSVIRFSQNKNKTNNNNNNNNNKYKIYLKDYTFMYYESWCYDFW